MDSYSGSEPRFFISFYLGNETSGQPPQSSVEEERMETSDSFVSALSVMENSPSLANNSLSQDGDRTLTTPANGTSSQANLRVTDKECVPANDSLDVYDGTPPQPPPTLHLESSSTDESCGAYIARKWEQLGDVPEVGSSGQQAAGTEKASTSAVLELTPGQDSLSIEGGDSNSIPEVTFLDSPELPTKGNTELTYGPPEAKVQRLCVKIAGESKIHSIPVPVTEGHSFSEGGIETTDEFEMSEPEVTATLRLGRNPSSETDHESAGLAGSTVADAMLAPSRPTHFRVSDAASVTSADFPEIPTRTAHLSGGSRALIKEYFEAATPIELPPGHSTIAWNEGQVSHILKVVADEAVRGSLRAMESLIQQTSRLNLGTRSPLPISGPRNNRTASVASDMGSQSGFTSGNASDTSGALRTDEEVTSLGYVYEHSDFDSQPVIQPPIGPPGCSRTDLTSPIGQIQMDSPGAQTLAALKDEALAEKTKPKTRKKTQKGTSRNSGRSNHRVPRGCKIMKEAYFKGMEWTKTFVSGPVDPRWNRYKFYCQICKGNISIYGRGAREILRHHASERHLRKDQRWRYEHMSRVDPVTKAVKHYVRGRDGKLLTPYELELELPKFIEAELVDIGEKLPFYEDYMQGTQYMASSSESRVKIQMSVLGHYLRSYGDIGTLRHFWRDVGVVVNHQALFTDFDWSKERLAVSILFCQDNLSIVSCVSFPLNHCLTTLFCYRSSSITCFYKLSMTSALM